MTDKKPGQMAYEAWVSGYRHAPFSALTLHEQARWARVEAAIRADERPKVIEEATNAAVIAIGDVDWISIADRGELQCVVGPAIRALREKKP